MSKFDRNLKCSILGLATLSLMLTSSCSEKQDGISGSEVCGGISSKAAEALNELLSSKRFSEKSTGDLQKVAGKVSDDGLTQRLCTIRPASGESESAIFITFRKVKEVPPPKKLIYKGSFQNFPKVGLRAVSESLEANIHFSCSGEIIHGHLQFPFPGSANTGEIPNNMTLLQDISRKFAQELDCPDNGGIPEV